MDSVDQLVGVANLTHSIYQNNEQVAQVEALRSLLETSFLLQHDLKEEKLNHLSRAGFRLVEAPRQTLLVEALVTQLLCR